MPALEHIHTYVRRNRTQYRCAHPDCTHYMLKSDLLGKRTVCGVCNTITFMLSRSDLRRAVPRCIDCSNTLEAKKLKEKKLILEELGII